MQVILLQRVEKLGQMGDVVNVKDGFARNFLLPQKKALRATKQNLEAFEGRRVQLEAENLEQRKEATALAARIDGLKVTILRQAADNAQLYGSVNARDIAGAVTDAGVMINRRRVNLTQVIKTLGIHDARIVLHPEVSATVKVNVARSLEEADQQEAGMSATPAGVAGEAMDLAAQVQTFFDEPAHEEVVDKLKGRSPASNTDEAPEAAERE